MGHCSGSRYTERVCGWEGNVSTVTGKSQGGGDLCGRNGYGQDWMRLVPRAFTDVRVVMLSIIINLGVLSCRVAVNIAPARSFSSCNHSLVAACSRANCVLRPQACAALVQLASCASSRSSTHRTEDALSMLSHKWNSGEELCAVDREARVWGAV